MGHLVLSKFTNHFSVPIVLRAVGADGAGRVAASTWYAGLVRVTDDVARTATNRDAKRQLSAQGRKQIRQMWPHAGRLAASIFSQSATQRGRESSKLGQCTDINMVRPESTSCFDPYRLS